MSPLDYIRLTDVRSREVCTLPLYPIGAHKDFEIELSGAVHEAGIYDVNLLSASFLGDNLRVTLFLDEEDDVEASAYLSYSETINEQRYSCYQLRLFKSDDKRLFSMCFGFARIEVHAQSIVRGQGSLKGITNSVPCLTDDYEDKSQDINEMVAAMTSSKSSTAASWMLSTNAHKEDEFSILEGSSQEDTSKSLRAYVSLIESILNAYESNLPYFRSRAFSRVIKTSTLVNARSVKKLGKRELLWLSKNIDKLKESHCETTISTADRYFMPTHVRAEKTSRTFDNLENRIVLSFLSDVSASLGKAYDNVEASLARPKALLQTLASIPHTKGTIPAQLVIYAGIKREAELQDQLKVLQLRAKRLALAYERALPDVAKVRFEVPRRTKVFQEVKSYYDLFNLMKAWSKFGAIPLMRDSLALNTFKIDKLYEYFVLLRMLEWFHSFGFVPDMSFDDPISMPVYSTDEPHFENETQVATVYHLENQHMKVCLHYQPVFYSDSKEEAGITLHRTVAGAVFSAETSHEYIWTPDYLITFQMKDSDLVRKVVVDAKFSSMETLRDASKGMSRFEKCLMKYRVHTGESWPGTGVDAVWLICGRERSVQSQFYQGTTWAKSTSLFLPSGITVLSPRANGIDGLFDRIGLKKAITSPATLVRAPLAQPKRNEIALQREEVFPAISSELQSSKLNDNGKAESSAITTIKREASDTPQNQADNTSTGSNDVVHQPDSLSAAAVAASAESNNSQMSLSPVAPQSEEAIKCPANGPSQSYLDPDIESLLYSLCECYEEPQKLFNAKSCKTLFGFNNALFALEPEHRLTHLYDPKPRDILGAQYYVYSSWRSNSEGKLKQLLKRSRKLQERQRRASKPVLSTPTAALVAPSEKQDPISMAKELYVLKNASGMLFEARFAMQIARSSNPIFVSKPTKKQLSLYKEVDISGEKVFILKTWKPLAVKQLEAYLANCKASS